jgi:hypothetical protein
MAAGTVGGFILSIVIGLVTCGIGFVLLIIPFAVSVIGLIEGVMYLTKSDEEFVRTYGAPGFEKSPCPRLSSDEAKLEAASTGFGEMS